MIKSIGRTGLVLLLMMTATSGTAHHSVYAEFDVSGSITIEGVVTEFWFKAPHIRVFVDVTDQSGVVTNWNNHGHNPNVLRRYGWDRNSLQPGDRVTMSGDPTHDGSPKMFIRTIVFEDGTVLKNEVIQ